MIIVILSVLRCDIKAFFSDTNLFHDKCYNTNINVLLYKVFIYPQTNEVIRILLFRLYKGFSEVFSSYNY